MISTLEKRKERKERKKERKDDEGKKEREKTRERLPSEKRGDEDGDLDSSPCASLKRLSTLKKRSAVDATLQRVTGLPLLVVLAPPAEEIS